MWKSNQVADFVGVKYRTLDHWVRSGLLSCVVTANGTGTRRLWSPADVTKVIVVNELRQRGHSLQSIKASGTVDKLTVEAIEKGVLVCTISDVIGIVPEFDPDLEAKTSRHVHGEDNHELPASYTQFTLAHMSHELEQPSTIIYATKIYESVKCQMAEGLEIPRSAVIREAIQQVAV